ncbi:MAG: hypothetical protein HYX27_23775 [Acidobacteria bacterium]|nr:hypothetical protein [Acidobacteriota bacterium]
MSWEAEEGDFTPAMLAGTPVPWKGLAGSLAAHMVLVPVLAFGFSEAVRRPVLTRPSNQSSIFKYEVVTLKLPADLMKAKPLPPRRVEVSYRRPLVKPAPAPAAAPPAPAPAEAQPVLAKIPTKATPKAFPMPAESKPEKASVVILQPPTDRTTVARITDMALPTITMVAPLPPRERRVFDVGSMTKKRSIPKPEETGPLPEPPQMASSATPIRPKATDNMAPKLPVYAAPPSLETIKAPDNGAVSAGGPVVENPANLVMASSRPVPARETVELPAAIVLPKGGNGAATSGGPPPTGAVPTGVAGGTPGGKGTAKPTVDASGPGKPGANGSQPVPGAGGAATAGGIGLADGGTPIRIVHPSGGRHDVMIVHSGVDQILPEARGLLDGDPIYTVYLNVGWSKEWIMHYCIPREKPAGPRQVGGVVMLGNPPEVRAPYPVTTMVPSQGLAPPVTVAGKKRAPMLFFGYLDPKGALTLMKQKGVDDSGLGEKILKSLESWEMRPATRGDAPARVQVILVVPMG